MSGEIDRKVLHAAMLRIEDCTSLALCALDTVARIDEEIYDCDNCILADTLDVKRDDILGREICPLDVKGDIYALR